MTFRSLFESSASGGSLSSSGSTDTKWDATWDWDTKGNYKAELNTSGSSLSDSVDKSWTVSSETTPMTGNYSGSTTNEYNSSSETHSHSESDFKTKANWLTNSSGATWTSESSGSSSSYLEKTSQNSSKSSWDWTLTESNYTKTDVGSSGQGSYDHTKETWESGYSGKSSSDGSSTLTTTWGGSQAHDWKSSHDESDAWTETWTSGSTSGSTSGGGSGSSQFVLQCLQTL